MVTVPAYFNDRQRQATKDAGAIAGLNIVRVVNEPTAAALAYGLDTAHQGERNILVYDLGGGTFDVSLLSVEDGTFQVLATAGDTRLGGEDFDQRLIGYLADLVKTKHRLDITQDAKAMGKLKCEAEKAKRTLSSQLSARIEIEGLGSDSRVDFSEILTMGQVRRTEHRTIQEDSRASNPGTEGCRHQQGRRVRIVLVGGSTRIPKIQSLVEEFFGKQASKGVNPDEAVAFGAAVQAGVSRTPTRSLIRFILPSRVLTRDAGADHCWRKGKSCQRLDAQGPS